MTQRRYFVVGCPHCQVRVLFRTQRALQVVTCDCGARLWNGQGKLAFHDRDRVWSLVDAERERWVQISPTPDPSIDVKPVQWSPK